MRSLFARSKVSVTQTQEEWLYRNIIPALLPALEALYDLFSHRFWYEMARLSCCSIDFGAETLIKTGRIQAVFELSSQACQRDRPADPIECARCFSGFFGHPLRMFASFRTVYMAFSCRNTSLEAEMFRLRQVHRLLHASALEAVAALGSLSLPVATVSRYSKTLSA